jgi:phospholipase C
MDTRREFLKKASLLAGGAGLYSSLPASIQKALAINPQPGSTFEDAEHIVFLMQENRSFDHSFGMLQGVRGFNDPRFISLPNQNPVWLQTNAEGQTYSPFRLDIKDTKVTWIGGLPHSWPDQVDARNDGKYDQWLIAKRFGDKENKDFPMTMGHYTREDLPFYYALADAFTICDQHFCASLTGTTPNRSFFWTGKIRADKDSKAGVRNSDLYYNSEANWKTFPERLEENDISWKVYQNEISVQTGLDGDADSLLSNFTDNNLEWFTQYNVRFHKAHYDFLKKRTSELPSEIEQLEAEIRKANKNQATKIQKKLQQKKEQFEKYEKELLTWNSENFEKLSDFEKNIHKKAFTTNVNNPNYHQTALFSYEEDGVKRSIEMPKGDILHQFRQDVNTGKLPTVSWLVAPQYFSDHPSAPWFGAWYVSEVLDILTKNPEVWKKTIFILNYDENDGYFDHVPPFVAPKPNDPGSGKVSNAIDTSEEYVTMQEELSRKDLDKKDARQSPVGLGYRVPMVIASPWSRGGWINSQVFNITSTLQFLEKFLSKKTGKEINEPNISEWRRMITGDLTSAFRPYNGEKMKLPSFVKKDPFIEKINNAKFRKLPSVPETLTETEIDQVKSNPLLSPLLPKQEKGIRDSSALPYQLLVDGQLSADKKTFNISFAAGNEIFGKQSAGAPFSIYAPGKYVVEEQINTNRVFENVKTWNYAVKAGDELKGEWPLDHFENSLYHLRVYGPNGFFREFKGDKNDAEIDITLDYERKNSKVLSGNVVLTLKNLSNKKQTVEIADTTYKRGTKKIELSTGAEVNEKFDLSNSYHWYDLTVKVKGFDLFEKRYSGRVETGSHSKSDPAMGGMI